MDFTLKSVGIDIGTTTTQIIISELCLENRTPGARIPNVEIVEKKLLYESDIYITPIIGHKTVDAKAVKEIIDREYKKAGIKLGDIDTGALIITGETAKKENAASIIHELSQYAGDFVVAVAGPDLESILAGKGAGTAEISKKRREVVANLDIGGGTTNIAVFDSGNLIDTACVNIGGRLIEVNPLTKEILFITKPMERIMDCAKVTMNCGEILTDEKADLLAKIMSEILDEVIGRKNLPDNVEELLMTSPLKKGYIIDSVMFSGGVATYIYNENLLNGRDFENYRHGDIGPILAKAIKSGELMSQYKLLKPIHTIKATVVGAGAQSVSISGSTTFLLKEMLPVKNISIGKVTWKQLPKNEQEISLIIREVLNRFSLSSMLHPTALAVPKPDILSFSNVELLAKGIYSGWKSSKLGERLLVIILEGDFAKVLGQTIKRISREEDKFICIDMISVDDGDYIDIGRAIPGEDVVPVVIKTLVF